MRPKLFFLSQDIFTYFLSLEGTLTGLFFSLKFYFCLFILLREILLLSKKRKLLYIITYTHITVNGASLIAQLVKNPPAMQETWVQSLGWEDSLEEGVATL